MKKNKRCILLLTAFFMAMLLTACANPFRSQSGPEPETASPTPERADTGFVLTGPESYDSADTAVLVLTARDLETDEIMGLTSGADDYMTKPFSIAVLKVRLQNILQRKRTDADAGRTVVSGDIVLDLKSFRASCGGEDMDLSMTEFRLLQYFMEHKNQALLKEQILQHIWDEGGNYVEENTLSVNVSRLRKKLGRDHIRTIQGIGYLWEEG